MAGWVSKFPPDFMFRLTMEEYEDLRSQFAISNRSQIVTGSQKHRNPRYVPYGFTEHGAVMAANILRSNRAIQMSVFVVRAFIRMRQMLIAQQGLARKLSELEKELTARLDVHETAINEMFTQIKRLLSPPQEPEPPKKRIGFLAPLEITSHVLCLCNQFYTGFTRDLQNRIQEHNTGRVPSTKERGPFELRIFWLTKGIN